MKWLRERRQQSQLRREQHAARTKGPAIGLVIDDPGCPDCVDKDERIADLTSRLVKELARSAKFARQNTELEMVNARLRQALAEQLLEDPGLRAAAETARLESDLAGGDRG